ncbi:hypothetical protein SAMN04488543_3136 [Friedmanniella luteola]|uniref:Lipoprotein LpqN n=1 Tax=Friedmanniella luteola TaxID=546871 RepID=A0A1H1XYG1_9ACTN|nr:hypothetical protein [Friedmanniella luteola]SDT14081.1 hypothetical protein SAMN04488543_3136 [Friedmanniella luteola]
MTPRSTSRLAALALVTSLVGGTLAGCGTPPWDEGEEQAAPAPSASATPTASPSPSPTRSLANDLAKGSAKRTLNAGGVEVAVNYYSDVPLDQWSPEATKPLKVSLTASFPDGSEQDIYLRSVQARVDVAGADGPLPAAESITDQADVDPGYLVTEPSSYSDVLTLPAVDAAARSVTLNLTYELLAQSAPKSKRYLKQTASDTLRIALAHD